MPTVKLMGILNVTPYSFSDGGRYSTATLAVRRALEMVNEGASVIDIGGESSRPGAKPVAVQTELKRVIPVITALRRKSRIPISIDTSKPEVAEAALRAGATWVNDITGLRHPAMRTIVARYRSTVVIMHNSRYRDVAQDIRQFFQTQLTVAQKSGIKRKQIILDPGIGFGKTVQQNVTIIRQLHKLKTLGYPILIGASRKSFIGKLTGADVDHRLPGTLAAHMVAVKNGATWLRVHDVAEHQQFFTLLS